MGRSPITVARDKERQAIALHLAGKNFTDIAEELGYTSRSTAWTTVMRALKRETSEDIADIRATEIARTDVLLETIWPIASDQPELVPSEIIPGVTYVVPSKAKLDAIDKYLRILERRSKYLGLDFSDGLAERQVQLNESMGEVIATLLTAVIAKLDLPADKRKEAIEVLSHEMRALGEAS